MTSLNQENFGKIYLGKGSKNAYKRIITVAKNGTSHVTNYDIPETDAKGRVIKLTKQCDNDPPITIAYTYY